MCDSGLPEGRPGLRMVEDGHPLPKRRHKLLWRRGGFFPRGATIVTLNAPIEASGDRREA